MASGAGTNTAFQDFENGFRFGYSTQAHVSMMKFNQAIGGAIRLETEQGLTSQQFTKQTALHRLTDTDEQRAGDNTLLTVVHYDDTNQYGVRLNRTSKLVKMTENSWYEKGMDPGQMAVMAGRDFAKSTLAKIGNIAVNALVGMASQTNWPYQIASAGVLKSRLYFRGKERKWGDNQEGHVASVMHSGAMYDVLKDQVENGEKLFDLGGLAIRSGGPRLGEVPIYVSNQSIMTYNDGTNDRYRTLLLKANAIMLKQTKVRVKLFETDRESHNSSIAFRTQYELELQPNAAFSVDKAAMGANPDVSDLAVAANWDIIETDTAMWPIVLIDSVQGDD